VAFGKNLPGWCLILRSDSGFPLDIQGVGAFGLALCDTSRYAAATCRFTDLMPAKRTAASPKVSSTNLATNRRHIASNPVKPNAADGKQPIETLFKN
jgi:hypothetical protein